MQNIYDIYNGIPKSVDEKYKHQFINENGLKGWNSLHLAIF